MKSFSPENLADLILLLRIYIYVCVCTKEKDFSYYMRSIFRIIEVNFIKGERGSGYH